MFTKQTGDVTVYLLSENTAGSDSQPSFTNITLTAQEWGALTYIPKSLNEDGVAAIGELLARSIARSVAKKADQIGFIGDGTSTYFGIKGITPLLTDINSVDDDGGLVLGSGDVTDLLWYNPQLIEGESSSFSLAESRRSDQQAGGPSDRCHRHDAGGDIYCLPLNALPRSKNKGRV